MLTDRMKVGEVRHPPSATALGRGAKIMKVARWRHRRIGDTPEECSAREINSQHHDGVGESRRSELKRRTQIPDGAHPTRAWPSCKQQQECCRANGNAGD